MNPYFSLELKYHKRESVYVFGFRIKDALRKASSNELGTLKGFLFAIGNPVRCDMFFYIKSHVRLTVNDLASIMNLSKPVINRNINVLREEKIVVGDASGSGKPYYVLNKALLKNRYSSLVEQITVD
jgi:DNA-binding transcriptional ArsR family regulator